MKNYLKAFLAMGAFLFASVGLAADGELNSENFESMATGSLAISSSETLWSSDEVENESMGDLAVVTAYESESTSGGKNYLALETGKPLYRNVFDDNGNVPSIGSGLYFEGDVQFSPYEEDVDTSGLKDDGTKLLVYIKGTEEATDSEGNKVEAATNFVVVAGYYNGLNKVTTTNYVCKVPSSFNCNKDVWHHLLLKSYLTSDGNYSYFKVFVDGTALTNTESKGADNSVMANIGADAFPSIDATSAPTTLSGIGFKGTGSVDNLKWTTVDPDPTKVMIAYVWSNGTFSLKVNGKDKTVERGLAYEFNENDTREVTFIPNDDYSFDETTDVTKSTENGVTTYTYAPQKAGAVVTVGDTVTYVKDFVVAVTLVKAQTEDVTLKMLTGATITSTDSIVTVEDDVASIYIGSENNTVTLILNENTLSIAGMGLFANGGLIIIDKSKDMVTDTGCIITKNEEGTPGTIYAPTMTVYGGKFDTRPCTDDESVTPVVVPSGYELKSEADSDGWYRLQKKGSSETITPRDISGGDATVDGTTITVSTSESGEITIDKDASAYAISVPQNVTKITGSVGPITIMGKGVDITGAFSVTAEGNMTTIALGATRSVTFTNADGNKVTVSVTPELDDAEGTEPFAVGDSVSATVKAIPGLTYQLLGSEDLTTSATKDWGTVGEAVTATNTGTVTLEDTSTDKPAAKFYVIRVSR